MAAKDPEDVCEKWGHKGAEHILTNLLDPTLNDPIPDQDRSVALFIAGDYMHPFQGRVTLNSDNKLVDAEGKRLRRSRDRWIAEQVKLITASFQHGLDAKALTKKFDQICPHQIFWFTDLQPDSLTAVCTHLYRDGGLNDYAEHECVQRYGNEYLFILGADYSSHDWPGM